MWRPSVKLHHFHFVQERNVPLQCGDPAVECSWACLCRAVHLVRLWLRVGCILLGVAKKGHTLSSRPRRSVDVLNVLRHFASVPECSHVVFQRFFEVTSMISLSDLSSVILLRTRPRDISPQKPSEERDVVGSTVGSTDYVAWRHWNHCADRACGGDAHCGANSSWCVSVTILSLVGTAADTGTLTGDVPGAAQLSRSLLVVLMLRFWKNHRYFSVL